MIKMAGILIANDNHRLREADGADGGSNAIVEHEVRTHDEVASKDVQSPAFTDSVTCNILIAHDPRCI